jgi:hypothetical protein
VKNMQVTLSKRVSNRICASRRILHVDTQRTRKKLIEQLEVVFSTASNYARGNVTWVTGEDGKRRPLTVLERQWWAKIAAQTAQTINNIARGFDERQIDDQLNLLEMMLNKAPSANQVPAASGPEKAEGKPAGAGVGQGAAVAAS